MTEQNDDLEPENTAPPGGSSLFDDPTEMPPGDRPDPRLRPPDPAGTQPKFDPDDLLPRGPKRALVGHSSALPMIGPAERPVDDELAAVGAGGRGPSESRFAPRFQFLLGALLAVGAAAVVLAVALVVKHDDNTITGAQYVGPAWSSWHPSPAGSDGATQIAEHVGREYRLPGGKQMVAVTGGPLEIAGLPVTIAMRGASTGDIKLIDGNGVLFRMCGLGEKCAIAQGKPSRKRHLLLRREALELALYSFRYLGGVDEAVVFLPPAKGQDPSQALYFRKSDTDLRNAVARPLSATLVRQTPSVNGVTRSPDAQLVQSITIAKLFKFSFTQANQDARAFLVLDPLPR